MRFFEKVDWDTVDYDKVVGHQVPLPDGSQHFIEMDMLHWYWVEFMQEQGETIEDVIAEALDILTEEPDTDLDELIKTGILAWGREWVRITEGH